MGVQEPACDERLRSINESVFALRERARSAYENTERKCDEVENTLRQAVRMKMKKPQLRRLLRQKKLLERELIKREKNENAIAEFEQKVQSVSDNVLQVQALREVKKEMTHLANVVDVDGAFDDLDESGQMNEFIDEMKALMQKFEESAEVDIDESELDAELEELMKSGEEDDESEHIQDSEQSAETYNFPSAAFDGPLLSGKQTTKYMKMKNVEGALDAF